MRKHSLPNKARATSDISHSSNLTNLCFTQMVADYKKEVF